MGKKFNFLNFFGFIHNSHLLSLQKFTKWNFYFLFLSFTAYAKLGHCIQVTPDSKPNNATQVVLQEKLLTADNSTVIGDSVLSASERNRRLIPYMAFYLPADFPINQQYAIQGVSMIDFHRHIHII